MEWHEKANKNHFDNIEGNQEAVLLLEALSNFDNIVKVEYELQRGEAFKILIFDHLGKERLKGLGGQSGEPVTLTTNAEGALPKKQLERLKSLYDQLVIRDGYDIQAKENFKNERRNKAAVEMLDGMLLFDNITDITYRPLPQGGTLISIHDALKKEGLDGFGQSQEEPINFGTNEQHYLAQNSLIRLSKLYQQIAQRDGEEQGYQITGMERS